MSDQRSSVEYLTLGLEANFNVTNQEVLILKDVGGGLMKDAMTLH